MLASVRNPLQLVEKFKIKYPERKIVLNGMKKAEAVNAFLNSETL